MHIRKWTIVGIIFAAVFSAVFIIAPLRNVEADETTAPYLTSLGSALDNLKGILLALLPQDRSVLTVTSSGAVVNPTLPHPTAYPDLSGFKAEIENEMYAFIEKQTDALATSLSKSIRTSGGSSGSLSSLSSFSTSDLAEGSNLYFTDLRVADYINGSSTIANAAGTSSGELLSWDGSRWTPVATSTLNIVGSSQWSNDGSNVYFTSGSVGLGTTSPSSLFKLDIVGGLYATASSTMAGINLTSGCFAVSGTCITSGGGGSGTVNSGTTGQIAYYAGNGSSLSGTSTLSLSTAGNLGVGTTSPFTRLSVGGAAYIGGDLTATGSVAFTGLGSGLVKSASGTLGIATDGTDFISPTAFNALFDNRLSATSTLPNITTLANLAAVGTIANGVWQGTVIGSSYGGAGTVNGILKANGSGVVSAAVAGTDYENPLAFSYPLARSTNIVSLAFGTTTANSWSQLQRFNGGASTTLFTATGATYLATAGGNVGIGTTSPSSALSVNGNALLAGALTATNIISTSAATSTFGGGVNLTSGCFAVSGTCIGSGSNPWLSGGSNIYFTTGNVGIGTTSPQENLSVSGSGGTWISVDNGGVSGNVGLQLKNSGAADWFVYMPSGTDDFRLSNQSQGWGDVFTVKANGSVGIGTTSPSSKLSVVGGLYATASSTMAGINLTNGCFAVNGTCITSGGGGSGTVNSGTTGQIAVYASNGTTLSATSSISGLNLNFLQAGTSSVSRTLDSKLKDRVSVKDFGAKGDGVTDDTAAIQAALNASLNVYFPPPAVDYRTTSALVLRSGQTVYGPATIYVESNTDGLYASSSVSGTRNIVIKDLFIVDEYGGTRTAGYGVHIDGALDAAIVDIEGVRTYGFIDGMNLSGLMQSDISFSRMDVASRNGMTIGGQSTSVTLHSTYADAPGQDCYSADGLNYSTFISTACDDAGRDGYHITSDTFDATAVSFESAGAETVGRHGMYLDGWGFTSNSFTVSGVGTGSGQAGIYVAGGHHMSFNNTRVTGGDYGLYDVASSDVSDTNPRYDNPAVAEVGDPNNIVGSSFMGSINIGTTTDPVGKLHVAADSEDYFQSPLVTISNNSSSALLDLDRGNEFRMSGIQFTTAGSNDWFAGTYYGDGNNQTGFGIGTDYQSSNQKLVVTAAGDVGIGTTSPAYKLDVAGGLHTTSTSTMAGINLTSGCFAISGSCIGTGSGSSPWLTSGSNVYFSTGAVGIGTSTPAENLSVVGSGGTWVSIDDDNTSGNTGFKFKNSGADKWFMYTPGNSDDFRLNNQSQGWGDVFTVKANGDVGIGTTSPTTALQVAGTITPNTDNSGTLGNTTYRWNAVYATNGTIQTSDERLKKNIETLDATSSFAALLALKPVSFNWIDPLAGTDTHLGFIAQDVQLVLPQVVSVGTDPDHTLGLRYTEFIPVLVKGFQDVANVAGGFKDNLIAWLGSATNGIKDLYASVFHAQEVDTDKLCVGGTCVTEAEFAHLVEQSGASSGGSETLAPEPPPQSEIGDGTTTDDTATTSDETSDGSTTPAEDMEDTSVTSPEESSSSPATEDDGQAVSPDETDDGASDTSAENTPPAPQPEPQSDDGGEAPAP